MAQIISIQSVAKALHPVADQDGNSPVFAPGPAILFKDGNTYPACFSYADLANGSLDLLIEFDVITPSTADGENSNFSTGAWNSIPELIVNFTVAPGAPIPIAGTQGEAAGGGSGSFTVQSPVNLTSVNSFSSQVTLNLGSLAKSGKTPWGFKDAIVCTTSSVDGTNHPVFNYAEAIQLEFYAVGASPARFLAIEGIPVDLLRLALLPITYITEPTNAQTVINQGYPTYAGQLVFNVGFVYETTHGLPNFAMGGNGDYSRFDLHSYLRAWNLFYRGPARNRTVEAQHTLAANPRAGTVNCFDQSGILWLILSLSLQTVEEHKNFKGYMVKPFGWLKEGQLVGWPAPNGTNNPFFRRDTTLQWVDPLSTKRKPFTSHVFLSLNGKIYDSCAGPHLGTEDLKGYLEARDTVYPQDYENSEGLFVPSTLAQAEGKAGDISEDRRGQVGGMDDLFDSGRYTNQNWADLQNHIGSVVRDAIQGGYSGMLTLNQDIKTALESLGYQSIKALGPNFDRIDFGKVDNAKNKMYGSATCVAWAEFGQEQVGIAFEINFCNTAASATAYMNAAISNNSKGSTGHPVTLSSNTIGSFSSKEPVGQNPIFQTLVVRFCIGSMFIELTLNQFTWSQALDFANSCIEFLNTNSAGTVEQGFSISTIVVTVGPGGSPFPCDETSPIQTRLGEIVTLSFQVTNLKDLDWRYETGNVFLRKWTLDEDTLVLEVVPRNVGGDKLKLNFYDPYFQTTAIQIPFNVTA
ncbi:hypothetical protein H072_6263 [Dactylellina haptotyla CBS 200.50]|uniref:Uncharacterized protein n=1 Tax=Dactylellina haptotyla (strain CBS 200.50) TaxID=1284197 RepID=S8BKS4_DACHA|nr:hypothetical protein H072_6263 [Dactylellina haptotyla CBS 200.50]